VKDSAPHILVVEDETALAELIRYNLEAEGFRTTVAPDGEEAEVLVAEDVFDLIVLDWMLPGISGLELCRRLRRGEATRALPVLMLTARGEEGDRIRGLATGADDYVVKPFSMRELLLRLRAVLSRSGGTAPGVGELADPRGKARFGSAADGTIEIDFAAYTLTRGKERHGLSRKELELLRYFLVHEGQTLDRLRLLSDVWGPDENPTTRTVDNHVLKLRKKLEHDPERPRHLLTVHGVGYRFSRAGEAQA